MDLKKYKNVIRGVTDTYVNVHTIQRGGVLTADARKALPEFGDGYSVCDYCFEARVDLVDKPPVHDLTQDIAAFLNMDDVRFTTGCRLAKWAAMPSTTSIRPRHWQGWFACAVSGIVEMRLVGNIGAEGLIFTV